MSSKSSLRNRFAYVWILLVALGSALVSIDLALESDAFPNTVSIPKRQVNPRTNEASPVLRMHPLWLAEECVRKDQSSADAVGVKIGALVSRNYRSVFGSNDCCCGLGTPQLGDLDGDGYADAVASLGCNDPSTGMNTTSGFAVFLGTSTGEFSLLGSYHPFNDAYYRALSICGDEVWVGYRHQTPENPLYDLPAGPITTVVQRFRVRGGTLTFVSPRSHDSD